jgi:transposase-like protein
MDFPLIDLMDQDACYHKLLALLHPDGLACPKCKTDDHLRVHRRHRAPVLHFRCTACGRVFNAFTGIELEGMHRQPAAVMLILRGFAQSAPTEPPGRELGFYHKHLLELRRRLQDNPKRWLDRNPPGDDVVEADEMDQNAGAKGIEHPDPDDPPRRRANGRRGHGRFANDRPPVAGMVGGESGEIRLEVADSSGADELGEFVDGS